MNFANVPQWAWIVLGIAAVIFAIRNGWLENLLARPTPVTAGVSPIASPTKSPPSFLEGLQGYRTKLAALVIGLLAANEVWHFLPEQYVSTITYLAGAGGLYFLRDAVERLKQKLDQVPPKA